MARLSKAVLLCLLMVLTQTVVQAHTDDPKVRDKQPPYLGEGYRAALRGNPPTFPSSGITLLSWVTFPEFSAGTSSANSCWGYVSPSGREYAIIGLSNGTGFVEVTNPANATVVALIAGPNSLWRDMKTYQNYCYSVSEGGNGIQVMDLSQIDNGVVTLVREVTTAGTTNATHTVAVDTASGFLYRCGGGSNGLRIYSLANPSNPAFVASWSTRYVHECQAVTYTSGPYAGRQIVFACTGFSGGQVETGLEILDVTNKASIAQLSRVFWPNAGYSHQIWLSPDRRYGHLNDEFDEQDFGLPSTTITFDVQNLSTPTIAGTWTNGNTAVGHNLYTVGNLIFEANYRSGLRVFDATNPTAPVEIAYYDTWPQDDLPNFNGLWNNYPYLPSGTIIGSDIEKGLFVWQLGENSVGFSYPNGLPTQISPAGQGFDVSVIPQGSAVLAGAPTLSYAVGAGAFTTIPLAPLGGDQYRASFPAMPCGSTVRFYLSAATTSGITWTDPMNPPTTTYSALSAYSSSIAASDTFEVASGWALGTPNTATTGQWVWGDPIGTGAQPEDDHTLAGTQCWFTAQGTPGGGLGEADVDGGDTTLLSAALNLSSYGPDVRISYWRWYSNSTGGAPNQDTFQIDISNNNGASWTALETVGPGGLVASGGWYQHEFRVADFVTPTSQVRLRFIASDTGGGSVVEAAVDDLEIKVINCTPPNPCAGDLNNDRTVNEQDLGILLAAWQTTSGGDADGDGDTDESDLGLLLGNWAVTCP